MKKKIRPLRTEGLNVETFADEGVHKTYSFCKRKLSRMRGFSFFCGHYFIAIKFRGHFNFTVRKVKIGFRGSGNIMDLAAF